MKNKKGFTLTEILATIVILGIILAIAVPSYNALSKKFEKEYYDKLDKSVLAAAKSYWKDNPDKRPKELLKSDHIMLDDLIKKKHIENVTEYRSKKGLKGYIIIINVGNGKYDYKTCIKNDSETWRSWDGLKEKDKNNINNYCNEIWKKKYTVNYNTITDDRVYLYVDEDYEMNENNSNELRKKLGTAKVASVTDSYGHTLKEIRIADGEDNKVYPENVTAVALNEKRTFKLEYSNGTRDLEVFKYEAPLVSTNGNKVTLNVKESDKALLIDKLKLKISKYQQYVNGNWEDISCEVDEVGITYYKGTGSLEVKYRFIDSDTEGKYRLTGARGYGNISDESETYTINLTTPELSVTPHIGSIKGPNYNGEWTNEDVYFQIAGKDIKFAYRTSLNVKWKEEASIPESIKATVKTGEVLNTTYQFADAKGKSEHSKKTPLEYPVKIDKVKPNIEVKIYDTNGNEYDTGKKPWTNKDLVLVAKVEDKDSGIKEVKYNDFWNFDGYEGNNNSRIYTKLLDSTISSVKVEAIDNAGNKASNITDVNIDKSKPYCIITDDSKNSRLKSIIFDMESGIKSKEINPELNGEKCSKLDTRTCYKYTKANIKYTLTIIDNAGNKNTCEATPKSNTSSTPAKENLAKPIINLSPAPKTTSDITFTLTNPNSTGTLYYSFDKTNWVKYPHGDILLINWTGSRKVYAYVKGTTTNSEISEATGYCNKDGVSVSPNALEGTYFNLKFTLPNNPSGVTNGKYEYIYWGAVATNDTENKQSSQTNECNLTEDLINKRKIITTSTTEKLYMKYQRQYYCFAVRPYRDKEITEINRWTIQRKHAKTVGTINSSNYNGVE